MTPAAEKEKAYALILITLTALAVAKLSPTSLWGGGLFMIALLAQMLWPLWRAEVVSWLTPSLKIHNFARISDVYWALLIMIPISGLMILALKLWCQWGALWQMTNACTLHSNHKTTWWVDLGQISYFLADQVLGIAFVEEIFYRGYLQSVWLATAKRPIHAWLQINVIFALAHFLGEWDWQRLLTFFPGLLFSWIRQCTSLWCTILVHALCNTLSFWCFRYWLHFNF